MVAGLILAAGEGVRFGPESKLLAELDGRPLLEHAIRAQCAVPELEQVAIVLGARADDVLASVELLRAEPIVCSDWSRGQAASLRCGMEFLIEQAHADRVVVTLGDEPLIGSATVARFVEEPAGSRALWHGRPGHPVVLGPEHLEGIRALRGDRGARGLAGAFEREIECAEMGGSGLDIDTREDLEVVRDEARAVL
ncbi:MAG: NTP transferase domain-containing protein [Solirubrobacteraceae bacterium]